MELTRRFANLIVDTNYENLPEDIVASAKERLLDTIGAMLAGRAGWDYSEALLAAAAHLGAGNSVVVGPGASARWPTARAAMLNATFGHALELDDGHKFAGVHAGTVVVATAMAMGAERKSTGREILAAIVLGYEVVYRLAVAQSPELINKGFHPSAICDTVGAAAVAGKLMNLGREQLANALGMAGLQAAGFMEATVSGQQSKSVMVGNAAYNGISCAYVAQAGLEGTTTVFEGRMGMFQAMSKAMGVEDVCREMGQPFWIGDTYNKFYPTCRHSQPAIEAASNIVQANGIEPEQVDYVEAGVYRVAYELTGTVRRPENSGQAKFSIAYGVAVALVDHSFAARHLGAKAFSDERYLALADRVNVYIEDRVEALYPKKRGVELKIVGKNGAVYTESCYDLKGSPQNPVGFDELVNKFVTAATGLLSEQAIKQVLERCIAFEQERDVATFLSLLSW